MRSGVHDPLNVPESLSPAPLGMDQERWVRVLETCRELDRRANARSFFSPCEEQTFAIGSGAETSGPGAASTAPDPASTATTGADDDER